MRCVTMKPPKMLTEARVTAMKPMIFEKLVPAGPAGISFSKVMGFLAVTLASVNIFGGFIVTQRMLQMFKKKQK